MRTLSISAAVAAVIILSELSLFPGLASILPEGTSPAVLNFLYALILAILSGASFYGMMHFFGHPSSLGRLPRAHKMFAGIVAHVTFSFEAVMYPLTRETVIIIGEQGAAITDACVLATIVFAVAYWLISLEKRTLNYGEHRSTQNGKSDRTLLVGVIFASCCITSVPFLASINQQISWQKTGDAAEIISLSGRQWALSQQLDRLTETGTFLERQQGQQLITTIENEHSRLTILLDDYATRNNLSQDELNTLPGNVSLTGLQQEYLQQANALLATASTEIQYTQRPAFEAVAVSYLPALQAAIDALQFTEAKVRKSQQTAQLIRVILGPFIFVGLAFGLFWPLLRLVNAQRHGLQLRRNQAEAATVAKSQFLATMSHELRTPMNGVLGMLQLLTGSELDRKQRVHVETAMNSASSLLKILNDILDFSKLESGQIKLETVALSPKKLTREVLSLLSGQAKAKGIELQYSVGGRVPEWVAGDPTRIRQILMNLTGNAIKFNPKRQRQGQGSL